MAWATLSDIVTQVPGRENFIAWQQRGITVKNTYERQLAEGWSLSSVHEFDPKGTVYLGGGTVLDVVTPSLILKTGRPSAIAMVTTVTTRRAVNTSTISSALKTCWLIASRVWSGNISSPRSALPINNKPSTIAATRRNRATPAGGYPHRKRLAIPLINRAGAPGISSTA